MIPHDDQVILFPHEDNCIQGIFHMPPWPNFPPCPCLDSQLPSNTELSLLCHNDESGRTLRLRTICFFSMIVLSPSFVFRQSMFCHGVLFPVVLVANAGPDMGHHGSFLTVCPLDQPDYSRNFPDLFQKNQNTVFLKNKTPTEIESTLFSPMTLRRN